MQNTIVRSIAVLLLLATSVPLALAQGTYTQIDVPGAVESHCLGIDAEGDIVGEYFDGTQTHGFLLSGGTYTTISYLGQNTSLSGINDLGQIVGFTQTGTSFLYDVETKTFTVVALPYATYAMAINNAGTIVGAVTLINLGPLIGFERFGGAFKKVVPRHFSSSFLSGVNNTGEVLGTGTRSGNIIHFLYNQARFQLVEVPARLPSPRGINDQNAIVGWDVSVLGITEGFLYQGRTFQSLMFPGSAATFAEAINNSGEVVGQFADSNGLYHGFLWTPPADAVKK